MISGKVAVIVLNWNQWEATQACLESLATLDYPDYKVILLDNASASPPPFEPSAICPGTIFMQNGSNRGFGAGNNPGIRKALERGAEYVWLLNNDTIVQPDALKQLRDALDANPANGAVGAVLYYPDGTLQAVGGGFVQFPSCYSLNNKNIDCDREPDFLSAASLLIKSKTLQAAGLFDERFFLYWEDVDLCFRIRAAGWRLTVAKSARIIHHEGLCGNNGFKDFHGLRSALLFARKHSSTPLLSQASVIFDRIVKPLISLRWKYLFGIINKTRAANSILPCGKKN